MTFFVQIKHGQVRFSQHRIARCLPPPYDLQTLLDECLQEKVDCIAVDRPIGDYPLAVQLGNELSSHCPVFVRFFKPPERDRISFSLALTL